MRLLLDSHALLWWIDDDSRLDASAHEALTTADEVVVSVASAWEIGIKQALGRLRGPKDLAGEIERNRFATLDIKLRHALAAAHLPMHHGDPFDRMLIAQAMTEGLVVVTRDRRFADYGVALLPA